MADRIHNPIHDNQFMGYFTKIPQTGVSSQNQLLKTPQLDFLNKAIKECIFPGINLSELRIPFGGHVDTIFPGDTFYIDPISIIFSLDSTSSVYKYLLNWVLIQKDIITGHGKNPNFTLDNILGEFVFEFLDVFLNSILSVKFDVQVLNLPSMSFTPNTSPPKPVDISVSFTTVDMTTLDDIKDGTA